MIDLRQCRPQHHRSIRGRIALLALASLAAPALAAALTVNSLADDDDLSCAGSPGDCTLREAINAANLAVGLDTIDFALPGGGPFIIQPTSALPGITGDVTIDGTTQPGFTGTPIVVLDGSLAGDANGLVFATGSGGSELRGLVVVRFLGPTAGNGVVLVSGGNTVVGNYIGIAADGVTDAGNAQNGLVIASSGNIIGGVAAADRNVISGNTTHGIVILPSTAVAATEADDNQVLGNYIGTNAAGTAAVANSLRGVGIFNGQDNLIGDPMGPGTGNLISGNTANGALVQSINAPAVAATRGADRNIFAFNKVGTDVTGTVAIPNGNSPQGTGINLQGNDNHALDNLASGNNTVGIFVGRDSADLGAASGNVLRRNRVGTNAAGTAALPNVGAGILLLGATNGTVGGTTAQGNLVSGNGTNGIFISTFNATLSSGNTVSGNLIGTDVTGLLPLGNGSMGSTQLGLAAGSTGNTISDNVVAAASGGGHGISLTGASNDNEVSNNSVGTDASGTVDLGNGGSGIFLNGVSGTIIVDNRSAFNGQSGVRIMDTEGTATQNLLDGNSLYSNVLLGIDLAADGVTANDADDDDTGPNLRQNFPVLTSAVATGGGMLDVTGTLDGPNASYIVQLFASVSCDPTGFGEGAVVLGAIGLAEGIVAPRGLGAFGGSVPFSPSFGGQITATATDEDGNTSELSACLAAVVGYLDVDGDGSAQPLTDALLLLRYGFGFSGNALVNGAVSGTCSRCTGPQVSDYLSPIESILDIDADGSLDPLTDGLLALRYLFGFRDGALVAGAVSLTCTRCLANDIEEYVAGLLPPPPP